MKNTLALLNHFWGNAPSIFDEDNFFIDYPKDFSKILNGKCDFEEDTDKYTIELEVPGVKKEEININLKDNNLTISWNRKKEIKNDAKKIKYERSEGSFTRSFNVDGADPEKIEAELKDGVLKLVLPKKENAQPKLITIR